MFFGCNQMQYPVISANVSGMTMVRSYLADSYSTWPVMPDNLLALLSIEPNPAILFQGGYDVQLTEMLQTAPPKSMLTAWHEANGRVASTGITANVARQVHRYMYKLVHSVTVNVSYGIITTQGKLADLTPWAIGGMDWYGLDFYDLNLNTDPTEGLAHGFSMLPRGPRVIGETNSSVVSHRPAWFREIYDWLAANGGIAMLTYWKETGVLSGPWLNDLPTISSLQGVSDDSA